MLAFESRCPSQKIIISSPSPLVDDLESDIVENVESRKAIDPPPEEDDVIQGLKFTAVPPSDRSDNGSWSIRVMGMDANTVVSDMGVGRAVDTSDTDEELAVDSAKLRNGFDDRADRALDVLPLMLLL
jgi:hypothetical protein